MVYAKVEINAGGYSDQKNPDGVFCWDHDDRLSGYGSNDTLEDLDAEAYRVRLLEEYGVGVISTGSSDIRVALSCVDEEDIESLLETMLSCALEMKKG